MTAGGSCHFERIIIGAGWSALGAVGLSCLTDKRTLWLEGTGSRLLCFQPSLPSGKGAALWNCLFSQFTGSPLSSTEGFLEAQKVVWDSKKKRWQAFPPTDQDTLEEALFGSPTQVEGGRLFCELEDSLRQYFKQDKNRPSCLTFLAQKQLRTLQWNAGQNTLHLLLESGETYSSPQVLYADAWNLLPRFIGPSSALRARPLTPTLQLICHHPPLGALPTLQLPSLSPTVMFGIPIVGESSDKPQRFWGYFLPRGSLWSTWLTPEEGQDNQQVTRRLKKMRASLEKIFNHPFEPEHIHFEAHLLQKRLSSQHKDLLSFSRFPGFAAIHDTPGPAHCLEILSPLFESCGTLETGHSS